MRFFGVVAHTLFWAKCVSAAPKSGICFGGTMGGLTSWKQYYGDGVTANVDGSACGFKKKPVLVTGLGGTSSHWKTTGGSATYSDKKDGYTVYINSKGIKTSVANDKMWASTFFAQMPGKSKSGTCAGATSPGQGWVQYHKDGLYLDVDTSACGFKETPVYKTSISGKSQWLTKGASSIYNVKKDGFRVYINYPGITVAKAKNSWQWHIKWIAHPEGTVVAGAGKTCAGKTVAKKTEWKTYEPGKGKGIYVDVKTGCKFWGATPRYVTDVAGTSSHWKATGTSEIYSATATGFRMYIYKANGITAKQANLHDWHVHWMAAAQEPQLCWGGTSKKNTKWTQYTRQGVTITMDTKLCAVIDTPVYVSSMGGISSHWTSTGSSAIYKDTWKSHQIYIYYQDGITVNSAKNFKWHMNFLAQPAGKSKAGTCAGQTMPAQTDWKQYHKDGVYVDVDTSDCGFSKTPVYKTSIGGLSQWKTKGSSALYSVTKKGFRVYIYYPGIKVKAATSWRWHIKWIAHPKGELKHAGGGKSCAGTSSASDWKTYKPTPGKGIYIDVKTGCNFGGIMPTYVTAIAGTSSHWSTTGASEHYSATPDGFRIFLNQAGGGLTPASAKKNGYQIHWIAAGTPPPTPAPTPSPPMRKVKKGGGWEVSKGNCMIDARIKGMPCIMSPNFPKKYGREEKCTVKMGRDTKYVSVQHFDTEKYFDYIQTGTAQYHGQIKPKTKIKLAGQPVITWSSDFWLGAKGFKICKSKAPKIRLVPKKKGGK